MFSQYFYAASVRNMSQKKSLWNVHNIMCKRLFIYCQNIQVAWVIWRMKCEMWGTRVLPHSGPPPKWWRASKKLLHRQESWDKTPRKRSSICHPTSICHYSQFASPCVIRQLLFVTEVNYWYVEVLYHDCVRGCKIFLYMLRNRRLANTSVIGGTYIFPN